MNECSEKFCIKSIIALRDMLRMNRLWFSLLSFFFFSNVDVIYLY